MGARFDVLRRSPLTRVRLGMLIHTSALFNEYDLREGALVVDVSVVVGNGHDFVHVLEVHRPDWKPGWIGILVVVAPGDSRLVEQVKNRHVGTAAVRSRRRAH